ncbi:MAG: helix-turn-helix transcriptional regulator [Acidobacteria bacterium]|jgi:PadR family transcriptional regulator, regulatory protein PadR|nr:helix-turn-helix transcriptional regulator [Acidobacteriota bacterium]
MGKDNLGEFELLVLLACLRLGEHEAYAVSIVDEILARTGREIHRAAVYVTLQRLEKKALISTRLGAPVAERGGKARRHVRVEAAGTEAVRLSRQAFQNMWAGLGPQVEDR